MKKLSIARDVVTLLISGFFLVYFLTSVINDLASRTEEKDKQLINSINSIKIAIDKTKSISSSSAETETPAALGATHQVLGLGIKITPCTIIYLILVYMVGSIFKKSYHRLEDKLL